MGIDMGILIGKIIKEYRENQGMSQLDLSTLVGVAPAQICQYESGKRIPRLKNFKAIVQILQIPEMKLGDIFYD